MICENKIPNLDIEEIQTIKPISNDEKNKLKSLDLNQFIVFDSYVKEESASSQIPEAEADEDHYLDDIDEEDLMEFEDESKEETKLEDTKNKTGSKKEIKKIVIESNDSGIEVNDIESKYKIIKLRYKTIPSFNAITKTTPSTNLKYHFINIL